MSNEMYNVYFGVNGKPFGKIKCDDKETLDLFWEAFMGQRFGVLECEESETVAGVKVADIPYLTFKK